MQIIQKKQVNIAVAGRSELICSVQDALDLMATAQYQGDSNSLIVFKESLKDDFFDLKTGLAGEILQKFSNYNVRLAIVGDFSMHKSKALHDFIYECNQGRLILWSYSLDAALDAFST